MNASISVSTVIYLFLALEILFHSSFAVSDTFGFTLASKRWGDKHWNPINSFGYRDVAHSPAEFSDREVLFVVGDSLVAGHGISHIEDRFSNILQRNLGGQYVVVNIAKSGWDTTDEYQALSSYPYKPTRVILAYYINDILGAAYKSGYGSPCVWNLHTTSLSGTSSITPTLSTSVTGDYTDFIIETWEKSTGNT